MPKNYKEPELTPTHWKALELIEENLLTYKQIAETLGWTPAYLYDLIEGNEQKTSGLVHLFQAELAKISQRWQTQEKKLNRSNRFRAQLLLNDRLKTIQRGKLTKEQAMEVAKIMGVLAKSTPNVEMSLTYYKGLTKEELENEFKKFAAMATRQVKSGTIPNPE
jgi:hypothetical protein